MELGYRAIVHEPSHKLEIRKGAMQKKYQGVALFSKDLTKSTVQHLTSPLKYRVNINK